MTESTQQTSIGDYLHIMNGHDLIYFVVQLTIEPLYAAHGLIFKKYIFNITLDFGPICDDDIYLWKQYDDIYIRDGKNNILYDVDSMPDDCSSRIILFNNEPTKYYSGNGSSLKSFIGYILYDLYVQ